MIENEIIKKLRKYILYATILKYIWWFYPISLFLCEAFKINQGFCFFINEEGNYFRKIFLNEIYFDLINLKHKNETGYYYPIFLSCVSYKPFTLRIKHAEKTIKRLILRQNFIGEYGLNYTKIYHGNLFP